MKMCVQVGSGAFHGQRQVSLGQFLVLFGVITSTALSAEAVLQGDLELLKMTAMAQRNNRGRIHTWQGSARIEVTFEDLDGIMMQEKSSANFLLDSMEEATRWKWATEEKHIRKGLAIDGKLASETLTGVINEMRKGDAFYRCAPAFRTMEGEKRNTLVILPLREGRKGAYSHSFDPMWYLKGQMTKGTDDLAEFLMFCYREANNPEMTPGMVSRDASIVTLEFRNEGILNRHEFDLSKGGSVVKYYAASQEEGTELREWTYESTDGVFIPKTFVMKINNSTPGPGGLMNRFRKVTFSENVLNRPVPASEFSLEKLGVTPGTRVSDHLTGLFYLYGGGEELALGDEDVLLKESPVVEAEPTVQSAAAVEEKAVNNEPPAPNDVRSETPVVAQVEQAQRPNSTKYFVTALVALAILGLGSFILLRKSRKGGLES